MPKITEQMIFSLAPDGAASAAANGRKISQKGGFVRRTKSADDSFFLGECSGSGKSNYITSVDFIDPAQPVFRCSCPSRQYPCKHGLALLYELMAEKPFETSEIPEDILQKRAKKQARVEKAQSGADSSTDAAPPKVNKAARTKKLQKQLEGLALTAKLYGDLLGAGLGAMGGTALATYRQLAKQLGDYYLPGPQRLLGQLIREIEAYQKDSADSHYERAVQILERLHALVKKSTQYLTAKLESGDVENDDNLLYEELGGAWKLAELAALGLAKQNARMAQLAFWVDFDPSEGYTDVGCWADLDSGEVSVTQNFRPLKALKHIKQDDTIFGAADIPLACFYPGEGNRRVRWEGMHLRDLLPADLQGLREKALPLAVAAKQAKNLLKNTLADPYDIRLVRFARIGLCDGTLALADPAGDSILLGDCPALEESTARLPILPDASLLTDQVLLGAFYYDGQTRRLMLHPLSILTPDAVVRLLY